jgi:phage tail P2-like protein
MANIQPRLMDHILPANATLYERTLASEVQRLLDLDIPIRELWNPQTCPENLLPYLAWAMSVDIWDSSWELPKRRSVVANAFAHHRLKGTLRAIEIYLGLIDSQIIKAQQPTQTLFSGPSLTKEQREAWLAKLPQVRVWQEYENSTDGKRMFMGGQRAHRFLNGKFPYPNGAADRTARRARWVVNGVETDQKIDNFGAYFQIFVKSKLPYSLFSNTPFNLPKKFPVPSTAYKRVITIEPIQTAPWRSTVGPQLLPVQAQPEMVAQAGHDSGHAVFSDRVNYKKFFIPSRAGFRVFTRYPVYDPTVVYPAKRPSIQFMGVGRYGIKPKTTELKVAMSTTWSRYKARLNEPFIPRTRFWTPHDGSLMLKNRKAIIAAKRLTDQILLDTNTKPGFLAGLPRFAGVPIII